MSRLLGIVLLCSLAVRAGACTIPVFRYALDRWQADSFQLILPPDAVASTADLLRPLRANGRANLDIRTAPTGSGLQHPVLCFPGSETAVWQGDLGPAALNQLLDSPARRDMVRRILAGDSVIWVVSGGDPAEAERIGQRLKFLEQVASLPIQDPNDPDSRLGPGPPLKLRFSLLRLEDADPAEALLRRMLAGPEREGDAPFAAAVFGRGRVLGSWSLAQLDDRAIEEACMFMVGRCSCRVKNENPGWDLLLDVDWDQALAQVGKATSDAPASDVADPEPPAAPPTAPETVVTRAVDTVESGRANLWAAGAALLLAIAAWRLLRRSSKD